MRRRSSTGGKPVKARRRKTAPLKRGDGSKTQRRRSSAAGPETRIAHLTRELNEALERQRATAEVLSAISRSKFELQSILQSVVDTASQLCRADGSVIFRLEGGVCRFAAGYSLDPAYIEHERRTPISSGPGTVIGRAAMTRQVVRIEDAWTDPLYEQKTAAKIAGSRSMIGVPLMREGEPIGAIGLARTRVDPFTQREIELVTTFADQAVTAIENARLLNELRESLQQQTATADVLKVISRSAFDLGPVFQSVVENAVSLCGADRGFLFRFDGELLRMAASYNASRELTDWVQRNPIAPGRYSVSARAALERRTVQVPDVQADPEYAYAVQDVGAFRTTLAVPMLKNDALVGVIAIYRLEVRLFTDKQIALVETFADQAVIAIENVRLFNETKEALEQQTATSEVLQVISSSPGDLEPVFETMLENAVRICGAKFGGIYRVDGDTMRLVATHNVPPNYADARRFSPFRPSPKHFFGRMMATKTVIHSADAAAIRTRPSATARVLTASRGLRRAPRGHHRSHR